LVAQAELARSEHSARVEMERQVDELCVRIQRKVADMNAAAQEHQQLQVTHQAVTAELEDFRAQVMLLQGQLSGQEAELGALQQQLGGYKQALRDKEHQLTVLLAEVERLHGRQVRRGSIASPYVVLGWWRSHRRLGGLLLMVA
jgi:predicted  nucleic acid-binding Zn-ribbon protein